jgi:glycosyltransferase involved in cell wall biosynthesis
MNVLLLSRYTALGASSRYRSYQYLPYLRTGGIQVTVAPLLTDRYLERLYRGERTSLLDVAGSYARRVGDMRKGSRYDLIWIEYEALPWLPFLVESLFLSKQIPYVVDYDDAVFHYYDIHSSAFVRAVLGHKIDRVMRNSALVIAGNSYLGDRARAAGARNVEILPSVVDLEKLRPGEEHPRSDFTVGWIGSPSTEHYLSLLRDPLATLCRDGRTRVVAIGARRVALAGVPFEIKPWTETDESAVLNSFDVGVMPLIDSPWERGKCGHKLIKYMACALPVVASPVGVNGAIVQHGVNGFLASSPDEWVSALSQLRDNPPLARAMGREGRKTVERDYCTAVTAPKLAALLMQAAAHR